MDKFKSNFKIIDKYFYFLVALTVSLMLLFGRSLMGLYLFGFRLGELLVGSMLIVWAFYIISIIKKNLYLNKNINLAFLLIPASFVFLVLLRDNSFLATYTFKSSSYIWTIGAFFIGVLIYNKESNIDRYFILFLNPVVYIAYILQVFSTPQFITDFFLMMGDKYEPLKGSDLAILFTIAFLLNTRYFKENKYYFSYLYLFSSLYLPFLYFKSRAAFIAIFLFLVFETILNRKKIKEQLWFFKGLLVLLVSVVIFTQSVFWVKQSGIIKIYEARENIVSLVEYRTQHVIEDAPSLFWISDNRLYSADGNLNWRMDIWQDIIMDLNNEDKLLFGYGYEGIIPVMEWYNGYRLGLDGLNEHVHNNWFNILARGGILQFFLFLYLNFLLIKTYKQKFTDNYILVFMIPALFVSFFDASMENAHFPLIYYFFLGRYFIVGK